MENILKINDENIAVKGTHIISVCDATDKRAWNLECLIEGTRKKREALIRNGLATADALHSNWKEYIWYLKQLHKRFLISQLRIENLTTTVGRSVLMQRLSGTTTYSGTVNYCALGTSNVAPVVGNTQLGTETYRKGLTSGTFSSNVAYLENFFTAAEVSGTFEEYGFFIDGNGSANTGQLWNRFIGTQAKTVLQTLNVQSIITLNSV